MMKLTESVMSDIDLLARESKSFNEFVKKFLGTHGKRLTKHNDTELMTWLKDFWNNVQKDIRDQEISEIRRFVAEEVSNVLKATLREADANVNQLADEFVKTVLKLGTRDNAFDTFLKKKNIKEDVLYELIIAVIEKLKKYV